MAFAIFYSLEISQEIWPTLKGERLPKGVTIRNLKSLEPFFRGSPTDITYPKLKLYLPDAQDKITLKLSLLSFHF